MASLNRRSFLGTTGALVAGQIVASRASVATAASDRIGIGMVGVGNRGTSLLRNLLDIPGVAIRAICDIEPAHAERASGLVTEHGQARPEITDDWNRLLEVPGVDAVVSALPCDLHAANYLDTLAAGKDLYGEKPMCLTLEDCDRVVEAAQSSRQIVQIGFQRRADPRFIETIQQVHDGELGDLIEGRIVWSNSWGPLLGWFGQRERSGDWMVEQAVHNWDVMNWTNRGLPVRALGLGRNDLFRDRQPDRDVHDYYTAIVEYDNGVIVHIVHSWVAPGKFNEEYTRLIGSRAGVDFNSGTISYRPDQERADRVAHSHTGEINNTLLALAAFVESVRTRRPPVATVEHGRDSVLACLLVRAAVDRRTAVTVDELRA